MQCIDEPREKNMKLFAKIRPYIIGGLLVGVPMYFLKDKVAEPPTPAVIECQSTVELIEEKQCPECKFCPQIEAFYLSDPRE